MCEPINPAPPVNKTRTSGDLTYTPGALGEPLYGPLEAFPRSEARLPAQHLQSTPYVGTSTLGVVLWEGLVDYLALAARDLNYHLGELPHCVLLGVTYVHRKCI